MHNAALFFVLAAAVLPLAEIVDAPLRLVPVFCQTKKLVEGKTAQGADDRLAKQNFDYGGYRDPLGYQDRQHLVGGGEEHGEHRADGDQAARIETRCRCGKAALRDDADRGAHGRAEPADALQKVHRLVRGPALEIFHREVRHKEKGNQFQGINPRVEQGVFDHCKHRGFFLEMFRRLQQGLAAAGLTVTGIRSVLSQTSLACSGQFLSRTC